MTTQRMSELLKNLLEEIGGCQPDDLLTVAEIDEEGVLSECQAVTFRDCGLLTSNDGIILSTVDGSEFQITIVRSK